MDTSILTSKGQFTIPVDLRRELQLHAGDKLNCFIEDNRLVVIPAKGSIKNLKGCIPKPGKPVSLEAMDKAVRSRAAARMDGAK